MFNAIFNELGFLPAGLVRTVSLNSVRWEQSPYLTHICVALQGHPNYPETKCCITVHGEWLDEMESGAILVALIGLYVPEYPRHVSFNVLASRNLDICRHATDYALPTRVCNAYQIPESDTPSCTPLSGI